MKTKSGIIIPKELADALFEESDLLVAWDKLRPSCQRDYAERIEKAKPEVKGQKIKQILKLTFDYANRHPEKYRSKKKM